MAHERHRVIYCEPPTEPVNLKRGTLTYIGNATLLIEYGSIRILTDPTFSRKGDQVDLGYGVSTTRLTDPALTIPQLPPLDAVVLSHFHGDHFDQVAERELERSLPIITTPAAIDALEGRGFDNVYPLDTWQWIALRKGDASITVTSMPGRHGPALIDFAMPDVMGSMLEFRARPDADPVRLYISGDTLSIDELEEIPERYREIDLGILHLGGTKIHGLTVTMDARQGVEVVDTVNPRHVIPIHYNDYDVFESPLSDFREAMRARGQHDRVTYVTHGDTVALVVDDAMTTLARGDPPGSEEFSKYGVTFGTSR
jgi:L-ascorbate metabolism protein UlaG (beta-lactamase superfamily)